VHRKTLGQASGHPLGNTESRHLLRGRLRESAQANGHDGSIARRSRRCVRRRTGDAYLGCGGIDGDKVTIPAINQVCSVSTEGGAVDLFCARPRNAHHQVTIFGANILVWKVGNPDRPAWSGKP
jgi:hypothetical protein